LNRNNLSERIAIREELLRRDANKTLLGFTKYTMPTFDPTWFHTQYYAILDLFAEGIIKKLIVTVPPQHGKSEGSTRRLPAYILGKDPDNRVAVASYNTPFARKFNRDIQRIIDTPEYANVFPGTKINTKHVVTVNTYLRNADEFEVINRLGSLTAVGRGGALTGKSVDTLIIDDIYKDYMEGNSPTILDNAWDWYVTVAGTRLHNESKQLIVFTRWNEADLVGRLEQKDGVIEIDAIPDEIDPSVWYKINYPAISTGRKTPLDPRENGEPLWPERHNLEGLHKSRAREPEIFESLYQGNPKPREGLLYDSFATYDTLPESYGVYNYTDTADTGADFLCSVNYMVGKDQKAYVLSVLYTDAPMETTEPQTAGLLDIDNVSRSKVESNNGGRGFARSVQKLVKSGVSVTWFHQSKNKEARIYTASAGVQRDVVFPSNWAIKWPNFYTAMVTYRKKFSANKHDDAPDTVTGIYETLDRPSGPLTFTRG
jgi:predicted phage terminase large subunit-like protein